MVRGGHFARFIYADMRSLEFVSHLRSETAKFQPELVIAASPQDKNLLRLLLDDCRPKHLELPKNLDRNFDEHSTGGLLPWHRVVTRERSLYPDLERNNLFLLKIEATPEFIPLVAATYGLLSEEITDYLQQTLNAEVHVATVSTPCELYALHRFMASRYSWLDFLNKGIETLSEGMHPPTVVLAESVHLIRDLGLYWNLKKHIAWGGSDESLLLWPAGNLENREAIEHLAETLGSSDIGSNYCLIRSAGKKNGILQSLARRLRPRMRTIKGTKYHVDTVSQCLAPGFCAYEREVTISISRDGMIVSVPRVDLELPTSSSSAHWYLDLKKDQRTNRYPFEFAFPRKPELLDLLNVPPGSFVTFRDIIGFGYECLSVAFTSGENAATARFQLPSEHEIFEVLLDLSGWRLLTDEKNTRYRRVLDLFDSIHQAALVLTGRTWKILSALQDEPLTYDALRGKAKLGKRRRTEALPAIADLVRERQRGIFKKIFEQRVRSELRMSLTKTSTDEGALEFLVSHRTIHRNWKIDTCPECNKAYWADAVDITATLYCPGCGAYVPIKNAIQVGYRINPLVHLAINEGIRPVLLTARFIRNLTSDGCIWYLGAKIEKEEKSTDLDLLAIADGSLIVGECKSLEFNQGTQGAIWKRLTEQLATPIDVAKELGARVFVLSSLVERYPKTFQDQLKRLAGDSIVLLLLTKSDLETGSRQIKDQVGHERVLNLKTLFHPARNRQIVKKSRKSGRSMWF